MSHLKVRSAGQDQAFCTVGLPAALRHIRLAQRDRPKSAVSTSRGHVKLFFFCRGHPAVLQNRTENKFHVQVTLHRDKFL